MWFITLIINNWQWKSIDAMTWDRIPFLWVVICADFSMSYFSYLILSDVKAGIFHNFVSSKVRIYLLWIFSMWKLCHIILTTQKRFTWNSIIHKKKGNKDGMCLVVRPSNRLEIKTEFSFWCVLLRIIVCVLIEHCSSVHWRLHKLQANHSGKILCTFFCSFILFSVCTKINGEPIDHNPLNINIFH